MSMEPTLEVRIVHSDDMSVREDDPSVFLCKIAPGEEDALLDRMNRFEGYWVDSEDGSISSFSGQYVVNNGRAYFEVIAS